MNNDRSRLSNLLPVSYRSEALQNITDVIFQKFLNSEKSTYVEGYVGLKKPNEAINNLLPVNQLFPIAVTDNQITKLNTTDTTKKYIEYNWVPPINIDKFINYGEYFWDSTNTPVYNTIRNSCNDFNFKNQYLLKLIANNQTDITIDWEIISDITLPILSIEATVGKITLQGFDHKLYKNQYIQLTSQDTNAGWYKIVEIDYSISTDRTFVVVNGLSQDAISNTTLQTKKSMVGHLNGDVTNIIFPYSKYQTVDGTDIDVVNVLYNKELNYTKIEISNTITNFSFVYKLNVLTQIKNMQTLSQSTCQGMLNVGTTGLGFGSREFGTVGYGYDHYDTNYLTEALALIENPEVPTQPGTQNQLWVNTTTNTLYQYSSTEWVEIHNNWTEYKEYVISNKQSQDAYLNKSNKWKYKSSISKLTSIENGKAPIIEINDNIVESSWVRHEHEWKYRSISDSTFAEMDVTPSIIELRKIQDWSFSNNRVYFDSKYGNIAKYLKTVGKIKQNSNLSIIDVGDVQYSIHDGNFCTSFSTNATLIPTEYFFPSVTTKGDAWIEYHTHWNLTPNIKTEPTNMKRQSDWFDSSVDPLPYQETDGWLSEITVNSQRFKIEQPLTSELKLHNVKVKGYIPNSYATDVSLAINGIITDTYTTQKTNGIIHTINTTVELNVGDVVEVFIKNLAFDDSGLEALHVRTIEDDVEYATSTKLISNIKKFSQSLHTNQIPSFEKYNNKGGIIGSTTIIEYKPSDTVVDQITQLKTQKDNNSYVFINDIQNSLFLKKSTDNRLVIFGSVIFQQVSNVYDRSIYINNKQIDIYYNTIPTNSQINDIVVLPTKTVQFDGTVWVELNVDRFDINPLLSSVWVKNTKKLVTELDVMSNNQKRENRKELRFNELIPHFGSILKSQQQVVSASNTSNNSMILNEVFGTFDQTLGGTIKEYNPSSNLLISIKHSELNVDEVSTYARNTYTTNLKHSQSLLIQLLTEKTTQLTEFGYEDLIMRLDAVLDNNTTGNIIDKWLDSVPEMYGSKIHTPICLDGNNIRLHNGAVYEVTFNDRTKKNLVQKITELTNRNLQTLPTSKADVPFDIKNLLTFTANNNIYQFVNIVNELPATSTQNSVVYLTTTNMLMIYDTTWKTLSNTFASGEYSVIKKIDIVEYLKLGLVHIESHILQKIDTTRPTIKLSAGESSYNKYIKNHKIQNSNINSIYNANDAWTWNYKFAAINPLYKIVKKSTDEKVIYIQGDVTTKLSIGNKLCTKTDIRSSVTTIVSIVYNQTLSMTLIRVDLPVSPDSTYIFEYEDQKLPNSQSGWTMKTHWKSLYADIYNTSHIHKEPWKLQSFDTKPTWWDIEYEFEKSWKSTMWDNIKQGIIPIGRELPITKMISDGTPSTTTYKIIPVNTSAVTVDGYKPNDLLPPYYAGTGNIKSLFDQTSTITDPSNNWTYGDGSHYEHEWYESLDRLYDTVSDTFTTNPLSVPYDLFFPYEQTLNGLKVTPSGDLVTNLNLNSNGFAKWVSSYNKFHSLSEKTFTDNFSNWKIKLGYDFENLVNSDNVDVGSVLFDITTKDYEIRKHIEHKKLTAMSAVKVRVLNNPSQSNRTKYWTFEIEPTNNSVVSYYAPEIAYVKVLNNQMFINVVDCIIANNECTITKNITHLVNVGSEIEFVNSTINTKTYKITQVSYNYELNTTSLSFDNDVVAGTEILNTKSKPDWHKGKGLWLQLLVDNTPPMPLTGDTTIGITKYFYIPATDNTFKLARTLDDAINGNEIPLTSNGSGDILIGSVVNNIELDGSIIRKYDLSNQVHNISTKLTVTGIQQLVNVIVGIEGFNLDNGLVDNFQMSNQLDTLLDTIIKIDEPNTMTDTIPVRFNQITNTIESDIDISSVSSIKFNNPTPPEVFAGIYYYIFPLESGYKIALSKDHALNGKYVGFTVDIDSSFVPSLPPSTVTEYVINPFDGDITITNDGIMSDLKYANVQTVDGKRLDTRDIIIRRNTNTFLKSKTFPIGLIQPRFDLFSHVLLVNQRTTNESVIYDPFYGNVISRLDLKFTKSDTTNLPEFSGRVFNNIGKLSSSENFETICRQFQQTYDQHTNEQTMFNVHAKQNIGFNTDDVKFLAAMGMTTNQQFEFWKQIIQNKGTKQSFDSIINSRRLIDAKIDEFWAYKTGSYGNVSVPPVSFETSGDDIEALNIINDNRIDNNLFTTTILSTVVVDISTLDLHTTVTNASDIKLTTSGNSIQATGNGLSYKTTDNHIIHNFNNNSINVTAQIHNANKKIVIITPTVGSIIVPKYVTGVGFFNVYHNGIQLKTTEILETSNTKINLPTVQPGSEITIIYNSSVDVTAHTTNVNNNTVKLNDALLEIDVCDYVTIAKHKPKNDLVVRIGNTQIDNIYNTNMFTLCDIVSSALVTTTNWNKTENGTTWCVPNVANKKSVVYEWVSSTTAPLLWTPNTEGTPKIEYEAKRNNIWKPYTNEPIIAYPETTGSIIDVSELLHFNEDIYVVINNVKMDTIKPIANKIDISNLNYKGNVVHIGLDIQLSKDLLSNTDIRVKQNWNTSTKYVSGQQITNYHFWVSSRSIPNPKTNEISKHLENKINNTNSLTYKLTNIKQIGDKYIFSKLSFDGTINHVFDSKVLYIAPVFNYGHIEYSLMREYQDTSIAAILYDKINLSVLNTKLLNIGIGENQMLMESSLIKQVIIDFFNRKPELKNVLAGTDQESITKAVTLLYTSFDIQLSNSLFFEILKMSMSMNVKYDGIFKTSRVSIYGVRPFTNTQSFGDLI